MNEVEDVGVLLARLEGKVDLTNATLAFVAAQTTGHEGRIRTIETAGYVTWKSVTLLIGAVAAVGTALAPLFTHLYGG